jgi:hypothetical protein
VAQAAEEMVTATLIQHPQTGFRVLLILEEAAVAVLEIKVLALMVALAS